MPSSQIKTCPIKSANWVRLVTLGSRTHTLERKEQWGMLPWRSTALCWQQENTEETLSTHCAHRGNLIFLFPAEDRHHSHTEHCEHSQIHSLLTQINTTCTFLSWCYLGVSVLNAQIKYVKHTGCTLIIIDLQLYIETLLLFFTDDRSDENI